MSLAHELRVLEIESQVELLNRLQLLTRFGSNLINISGVQGSGKSWIAQRYLEAWSQDKNQSLLMCHQNQNDEQMRAILLKQVVSDALFNESDPIVESFAYLMQDRPCDVVIVIDDAHRLSENLLAELWTLVLEAQTTPSWTVNVILFTSGHALEPVLTRLSYGQETKPISLEIDPLTEKEAETFSEMLVVKYVTDAGLKKKIRQSVKKTSPLPGALMALGESKMERKIIIRSIIGSPTIIAAVAALLLLLVAGGYFWFFSQPLPEVETEDAAVAMKASSTQDMGTQEQTVLPVVETTDEPVTTANSDKADDAVDDTLSLPPEIQDNADSVGQADDGQRVVVPAQVVDALIEGDKDVDTSVIDDAVADAGQKAREQSNIVEEKSEPVEAADQSLDVIPPPVITFSFAKDELEAVPENHYTLQLAALLSLEEVEAFINQHQLNELVRVYPTVRNDTEWYIVTYQDFPSIQAARDARLQLPESVQMLEPWAKSMRQVHRELELAK
ncbi:cell division protein DamX [Vibrio albus]|jgi:DamX protein|uniref:Cell division protein DamX n=1 Tax=Vibrio albus TaxID=2200953 RepID=A0A2U3B8T0_9VIBR|nr:AAA family ATPase [Vibrio albus]PWI33124.1 cell division protein DamX [Vibrio albus]